MNDLNNCNHKKLWLLLLQVFFASCVTIFVLLIGQHLFLQKKSGITISFTLQYERQERNHCQIFYAEKNKGAVALPAEYLNDTGKVKTLIPIETLQFIRLDFGSMPGKVICRDFKIMGSKTITMSDLKLVSQNQLKELKLTSDGLTCTSSGVDPFVYFQLLKPVSAKNALFAIEPWPFWIILVSVFIIAFAISKIVTLGNLDRNCLFWADGVLILFIIITLFVPMCNIDNRKISAGERRRLAEYIPLISNSGKINFKYGKNFDDWFNDHFFGRTKLQDFNNFLFLKTKSPLQPYSNVYSGFDNWYFYSQENALRNYHNLDLFSKDELTQAADNLKRIQKICQKYGKKLYLIIVPDKHKVYGEYFPGAPKIRPDSQSRPRQLEHFLQKNTSVKVINLLDALLANKKQGFIYWKNSTHWNEMGAYVGYLEIMRHIQKDFPDIPLTRLSAVKPQKSLICDNLNALLPSDETLYPFPYFTIIYKTIGNTLNQTFVMLNPKGKYNVLFLRDSFSCLLLPYMGNSFKSITALWTSYKLPHSQINAFKKADIVMFECVDRLLPYLLSGIHATRLTIEQGVK